MSAENSICQPPNCKDGDCVGCRSGNLWCEDSRCYPRCPSCPGLPNTGLTTGILILSIIIAVVIIGIIIYAYIISRRSAIAIPVNISKNYETTLNT